MTPSKVFILALCVMSSACISLPDIDDSLPEPDGGPPTDGGTDGGTDQTPPTLVRTTPPHGSTRVPVDSTVELEFSEAMVESSLQLTSVPTVSFTLESWAPESKRAVFRPSTPLAQDQQYALTVEGKDLAGNSFTGSHSFAFTTVGPAPDTTPPVLVSTSPLNRALALPRDTQIKLTFSEPMNRASVERAFSIVSPMEAQAGTMAWNSSSTVAEFTPDTLLPYTSTVAWELSAAATDLAGNPLSPASSLFYVATQRTYSLTPMSIGEESHLASTASVVQTAPWNIGDNSSNRPLQAFVSFHLQPLFDSQVTRILSSSLKWRHVDPGISAFNSLGRFAVDLVSYPPSSSNAFTTAPIGQPVFLTYQDLGGASDITTVNVTPMVLDSWANHASRYERAQFRLKFESWTDQDSTPDFLQVHPFYLVLEVTCEQP